MSSSPAAGAPRQAAFFDLDRTLISGSSTFPFAIWAWRHEMVPLRELLHDVVWALTFRLSGASDDRSIALRERILSAVEGADQEQLREMGDQVLPQLLEKVRPEARSLLEMHAKARRDVYVISASPIEIVEPLAAALSIAGGIGTKG